MLRFLLDPDNNKKNNIQAITKLIHAYDGTEEEFLKALEQKYITQAPLATILATMVMQTQN